MAKSLHGLVYKYTQINTYIYTCRYTMCFCIYIYIEPQAVPTIHVARSGHLRQTRSEGSGKSDLSARGDPQAPARGLGFRVPELWVRDYGSGFTESRFHTIGSPTVGNPLEVLLLRNSSFWKLHGHQLLCSNSHIYIVALCNHKIQSRPSPCTGLRYRPDWSNEGLKYVCSIAHLATYRLCRKAVSSRSGFQVTSAASST